MSKQENLYTEQDAVKLGFIKTKEYPHDQFVTRNYRKGVIEIDFTYKPTLLCNGMELHTVDITLLEVIGDYITLNELVYLDAILNKDLLL